MLIGDHVGLRAIEREDLPQLLSWRNQPELRRFFRERRELGMCDQLSWFELVVRHPGDTPTLMFAIEERDPSALVGACGLCNIDWVDGTAEVSLYIGAMAAYIDETLAPDACRILISHAFDDLNLRRLWVEIYDFDTRKAQLLEQAGFSVEGRLREHHFNDGGYHDSLMLGLLRTDRGPQENATPRL